ncbi:eosinophil granule major basic protein 1-like [Rhinatrema bivittatum]|uniref:eosinophil granule major basic protein 1-like n=1 Tax=Rhinatrema bivittatum TaxID=194408 RepID=UPI001126C347|nr:eosinophil granule major basic protein 1-like [Rhinatrema bivittatum]
MGAHVVLLLLLLGTISAQESGQGDLEELSDKEMDSLERENCTAQCEEEEAAAPTSDCQAECKEDGLPIEGLELCSDAKTRRYRMYPCCQTFEQAQCTCRRNGGQLASIHNLCINNQLTVKARSLNIRLPSPWIGAQKACRSRNFAWTDRSGWNYRHWACGEPRICGRKCVTLDRNGGWWHTSQCGTRRPFICEF